MALLGVDIPPLEGVEQLCTLEMMECLKEFVDGKVEY